MVWAVLKTRLRLVGVGEFVLLEVNSVLLWDVGVFVSEDKV
jgi:hypothetical protein